MIKNVNVYQGNGKDLTGNLKLVYQKTHQTIQKVTSDIEERFHFNTSISAVMELINVMYQVDLAENSPFIAPVMKLALESVVRLLSPIVPHICEEIWAEMRHQTMLLNMEWPTYDQGAIQVEEMLIVVQVNGKLRSRFTIEADVDEETIKAKALADEAVKRAIQDKPVKKVIVVQGKLVNIVI